MKPHRFRLVLASALLLAAPAGRAQTPPELPAQQVTVLFGQKILYCVGTGATVVLLHGMGSSAKALLASVFHGGAWRTDDAVRADYARSMSEGDTWTTGLAPSRFPR